MTVALDLAPWARPALVVAAAVAIDLVLGEPPARLHPVVWMGRVITALERRAPRGGRAAQLAYGAALAAVVPALFAGGALLACRAVRPWPLASVVVEALLLKSSFAVRALGEAAGAVSAALRSGDLDAARARLASLCSRDASALPAPLVAAAAVESVAENASDSAVAPLLFFAVLGVPGAVAYRAVNTLDARVGYRGRYEWLGKASARLDDLLNLVPARVTAGLLLLAGAVAGADARRGAAVLLRDGARTESPNAGRPMAAMAGLLGVELEKVGHYRLGDPIRPVTVETVTAAWRVVTGASLAAAALAAVLAAVLAAPRGGGWLVCRDRVTAPALSSALAVSRGRGRLGSCDGAAAPAPLGVILAAPRGGEWLGSCHRAATPAALAAVVAAPRGGGWRGVL